MSQQHGDRHDAQRSRRSAFLFALLSAVSAAFGAAGGCQSISPVEDLPKSVRETGLEVAVEWSRLGYEIAYAEDEFLTFKGQRALAMMHLAMHDALQAIVPLFSVYAHAADEPDADPTAATAKAAYEILVAAYPDRGPTLEDELASWLGSVPDGRAKSLGIALGSGSAATLIGKRQDDNWDLAGTYEFRSGPGSYQTTPPWDSFVLQPGFRHAQPFSFDDPARFRPGPPPPLDSPEYATALTEVSLSGDSASAVRTADETGYAVWWMEFAESGVARVARRLLTERKIDLWRANRALAHLYVALFDGYIANWDSKYEYNHWRPYTAIRAAADDGNPSTRADPDWVPLRPTPPFPEYASAHATGCAAAFEVLTEVFGDGVAFENTSLTAPSVMPKRQFNSFHAAAEECADSRIQLGWHYRYATEAGLEAGRRVARHVLSTTLAERW